LDHVDEKIAGTLVTALRHERIIAVDTESNSLFAYQEQVCLIQFSTTEDDYLVDPLALDDLSSLEPIFSSTEIEKVFHAAEYDLICLSRDFDFTFTNLFDTMVAARILGREAVGLGSMLEDEFGVRTDKRFQRADWGRRPLPTDMKNYARMDTRYLIPLRDHLLASLHQNHLWTLAKEDFNLLCQVNGIPVNGEKKKLEEPWGIRGAVDLTPQGAAVLLELCRYRDKVARRINRPLFKVINNQTLLVIASDLPRN
jgi:ribonuclease D